MTRFGILHLTDLHYGLKEQESIFPNIRRNFFEDLKRLYQHSAPWDLILFTGDLVQSGEPEQFNRLNDLLEKLNRELELLGCKNPVFLAIPGNHDLQRPDAREPAVKVLTNLCNFPDYEQILNDLLNDDQSKEKMLIDEAFSAYTDWWRNCPLRSQDREDFTYNEGAMPGDFTAILEKDGARLGIVGLNSTFLQLTAGDFEGKLAINIHQFHKACQGSAMSSDSEEWLKKLHAAILMTHQPPSWLMPQNHDEVYSRLINDNGRFAAHFFGHMHLPDVQTRSSGFSNPTRLIQGGSLFGLETQKGKEPDKLICAYSASEILMENKEGKIRLFPRRVVEKLNNSLRFDRDMGFHLEEEDGGTGYNSFQLFSKISPQKNIDDHTDTGGIAEVEEPLTEWRPNIPPMQKPDFSAFSRHNFVGREGLIREFEDALYGLHSRNNSQEVFNRNGEVQLFWLHGFGGMGKSWFLRQACVIAKQSTNPIEIALIDWHLPEFHKPASQPPRDPRELFDAIAYRLADLYGIDKLSGYWKVRKKVEDAWSKHLELHDSFDESLSFLQTHGEQWLEVFESLLNSKNMHFRCGVEESELKNHLEFCKRTLQEKGINLADPMKFATRINEIRKSLNKYDVPDDGTNDRMFENWAHNLKNTNEDEALRPCQLLAEALQITIRKLCEEKPLLLVLDTCELLPQVMDSWLRRLLAPLLVGHTRFLTLVGSRLKPDAGIMFGQRAGWKEEVDRLRFRIVPFDEEVRFTASEIERVLQFEKIALPASARLYDLSDQLLRVTLGVPLALGALLMLHREGESVFNDLASFDVGAAEELDSSMAVEKVIEEVAKRFLLHLENRPELANDLRDVIALALLRKVDSMILHSFWGGNNVKDRLRELMNKYDLLANGDLHDTVRDYLRRFWRQSPNPRVKAIAEKLLESLQKNKPDEPFGSLALVNWEIEQLNLLSWIFDEEAYPQFARLLVIMLAFDLDTFELSNLAQEIQPITPQGQLARKMLNGSYWYYSSWLDNNALQWLQRQPTTNWEPQEIACLDLITGLNLEERQKYSLAAAHLEKAFNVLGENIPQRDKVARIYFRAIYEIGQTSQETAESAYQIIDKLKLADAQKWEHDYYWILHNAKRFEQAEAYCRQAIEKEPNNVSPYLFLGHILGEHLDRFDEAESFYNEAISKEPKEPTSYYFLGTLLFKQSNKLEEPEQSNKREAAETAFRKALEFVALDEDKATLLISLAGVVKASSDREAEVKKIYEEIISLKPNDTNILNSFAWHLYIENTELEKAESLARTNFESDQSEYILHTLAAILVRRNKWYVAKPKIKEWLQKIDVKTLKSGWSDYQQLFYDVIQNNHSREFLEMLAPFDNDVVWLLLKSVMQKITDNLEEFPDIDPDLKNSANELAKQLLSDKKVLSFPSIP
jgi:tetratricopeptide (TPR) repeat protein